MFPCNILLNYFKHYRETLCTTLLLFIQFFCFGTIFNEFSWNNLLYRGDGSIITEAINHFTISFQLPILKQFCHSHFPQVNHFCVSWSLEENVLMQLQLYSCDFNAIFAKFGKYYILLAQSCNNPPNNTKILIKNFISFETHEMYPWPILSTCYL